MSENVAVTLNEETDFSRKKLSEFLNEKYGEKGSGQKFNVRDIQQYMIRGYLPEQYGYHPIEEISIPGIGIKVIRVNFDKTHK